MPELMLPDGRKLSYAQYGAAGGEPLFVMHGLPGSRLQRHPDDSIARRAGVRLIHIDRPGFGDSSPHPGRRLLDWPRDVAHLADKLGLGQLRIAGVSGGGPWALACAHALGERVRSVALVSSIGPPAWLRAPSEPAPLLALTYRLGALAALPLRLPIALLGMLARRRPDLYLRLIAAQHHASDRTILANTSNAAMLSADVGAAFRQGAAAMAYELHLVARDWEFDLASIAQPCTLWHGKADSLVPASHGRLLARAIPGCRTRFLENAGHFFVFERWPEILADMLIDA